MPITSGQGNPIWTEDETILALDLLLQSYPEIPDKNSDEVRELSTLLQGMSVHDGEHRNTTFRNPDGVGMKIQNLLSLHPDRVERKGLRSTKTGRKVWNKYFSRPEDLHAVATHIRNGIIILSQESELPDEDDGIEEGATLWRVHRSRDRKGKKYRPKVITRVEKLYGRVQCEACRVTPFEQDVPQKIVEAMYEVHHIMPLAEVAGTTKTRLQDLALLCANCHRLLHAIYRQEKEWIGVEELREWLTRSMNFTPSALPRSP
jgi:5-methylcytosine-specific restriction protein A